MIAGTHLYTWVKRYDVELSFLSKGIAWQQRPGLNHQPARLKVQCANHWPTMPLQAAQTCSQRLKQLRGFLFALDVMLVHQRVTSRMFQVTLSLSHPLPAQLSIFSKPRWQK